MSSFWQKIVELAIGRFIEWLLAELSKGDEKKATALGSKLGAFAKAAERKYKA